MKLVKKYRVQDVDKKFDHYTRVPIKIINDKELSLCSFKILISLIGCTKKFNPSMLWLMNTVGVSKRTLDKGIKDLKDLGYLKSQKIGFNDYQWTIFI
ncbi:MAG: hypothetical protein JXR61_13370 [Prolixibacteraceae bacterium]|nr:hypothetical protein [Prolixibacteraceae bacterium]